jgi:hypothetical protein
MTREKMLGFAAGALVVVSSAACQIKVGEAAGALQPAAGVYQERGDKAAQDEWAGKQKEFDAKFADEIAAYRALEPELQKTDTATADVADRAEALRARFLARCVAESSWSTNACWNGTFARDITLALAKIRLRLGDLPAAAAEAYTLANSQDLRSDKAKLALIHDGPCDKQWIPWCSDPDAEGRVGGDLYQLTFSSAEQHLQWQGEGDAMIRHKDTATFTYKPTVYGAGTSRSCGDPEWRTDSAGNQVLVRPCETEHYSATRTTYAPATVPVAELVDYKRSKDMGLLVVSSTQGKHMGHVVETFIDTHQRDDRGFRILKFVRYRGIEVRPAKPGYP